MLGPNVVLPPLGPLFARQSSSPTDAASSTTASISTTGITTTGSETPPLRTPTSVHAYLSGGAFPSSSPVKKDDAASASVFTPEKKKTKKSASKKSQMAANMLLLSDFDGAPLPSAAISSSSSAAAAMSLPHDDDDGSASPTCEDEKLRLSRERNRLHAQRTRIRKRELLESLKERIHALQREHGLLRQAFEFHATAVSLLTLGASGAGDDPSIKHLEDVSDAALELFESTTTLHHAYLDDDDDDALLLDECASHTGRAHDKSCDCYDDDGNDSDHADSSSTCSCSAAVTAMAADASDLVNSNGKRLHASSAPLAGSKEEREQLRRERNRLHARRARLRKKLVLERSQQVRACANEPWWSVF